MRRVRSLVMWAGVGALVGAMVMGPAPASAQVTIGARLGWNLSTLRDVDDLEASRETATVGGVYVNFGGTVSFQPELLFSKREASLTNGGESAPFVQNFVEVPVLAVLRPGAGALQPALYGGASVAFETDCDTDWSRVPDGPGGCDGFFGGDTDSPTWTGILGGALHLSVGPLLVGLDARYNHGLTAVGPGSDATWSFWSVGLEGALGLGR